MSYGFTLVSLPKDIHFYKYPFWLIPSKNSGNDKQSIPSTVYTL